MTTLVLAELLLLAALWGSSFLFMRIATPEFGPIGLITFRVGIAAVVLTPILLWHRQQHWIGARPVQMVIVGALNSALPFTLFAFATLTLTAGFVSVLNATVPLFTAIVAFVWLKDRMTSARSIGLALGVVGVTLLAWDRVAAAGALRSAAAASPLMAIGAALLATLSYGIAANYSKRYMNDVPPLASATGSQWGATLALLPIVPFVWPDRAISPQAWACVIALGCFCTALAYVLYFRLLSKLGPTKAVCVTFIIPVFGMFWGSVFLAEIITLKMLLACLVIALGTALSTGLLWPHRAASKRQS